MKSTQRITCNASTSISTVLSSVTALAQKVITDRFPEGFFKSHYITDSLAEVQKEEEDIVRLSKPSLIITPQYTTENGFMELIPRWHYQKGFINNSMKRNYNGILFDAKNDIYVYSIPDRVKCRFDYKIKLPSVMYAYNVLNVIKQYFEVGGYGFMDDITLNTQLPKAFTDIIAEELGIDRTNPTDNNTLEEYMINHSYGGLFDTVNLASSKRDFMYSYKVNILQSIPDEPTYEKNSNNAVVDSAVVNFSVELEFWIHSTYLMEIKTDRDISQYNVGDIGENTMRYEFFVPTTFIREQISDKMYLLVKKPFVPDINTDVDELPFSVIIDKDISDVIDAIRKYNFAMDTLLEVKVLANNQELDKNMYDVDWTSLILKTKKPMSNVTYVFLLYGDMGKLNLILKYLRDGKEKELMKLDISKEVN